MREISHHVQHRRTSVLVWIASNEFYARHLHHSKWKYQYILARYSRACPRLAGIMQLCDIPPKKHQDCETNHQDQILVFIVGPRPTLWYPHFETGTLYSSFRFFLVRRFT